MLSVFTSSLKVFISYLRLLTNSFYFLSWSSRTSFCLLNESILVWRRLPLVVWEASLSRCSLMLLFRVFTFYFIDRSYSLVAYFSLFRVLIWYYKFLLPNYSVYMRLVWLIFTDCILWVLDYISASWLLRFVFALWSYSHFLLMT